MNGDGIYEWTAIDASWEGNPFFSHAGSPRSYARDGTAHVDATPRFLDALLLGAAPDPNPLYTDTCSSQEVYLLHRGGPVRHYNGARIDRANHVIDQMRSLNALDANRAQRDAIVDVLTKSDPHLDAW